jgi:predicted amidohydrolase YtcJ
MEELVGSLEKGKQADYIILNKDITADKYMLNTSILATYIDAKKVK